MLCSRNLWIASLPASRNHRKQRRIKSKTGMPTRAKMRRQVMVGRAGVQGLAAGVKKTSSKEFLPVCRHSDQGAQVRIVDLHNIGVFLA